MLTQLSDSQIVTQLFDTKLYCIKNPLIGPPCVVQAALTALNSGPRIKCRLLKGQIQAVLRQPRLFYDNPGCFRQILMFFLG